MVFSCTCIFIVKSLTLQSEMSTPLNKYHPILIHVHVYSAMTTKLAIILILRNATHQAHENKYKSLFTKIPIPVTLLQS